MLQAAIQRAASRWAVQSMSPHAAAESITSALQQLQKDSQQQLMIAKHVRGIEAKVNALEGSILTAGRFCIQSTQDSPVLSQRLLSATGIACQTFPSTQ